MHAASATAHTAVDGAGVHTTALPHASAGAISSAGIVYGQFQGLITPTTPRGRRTSITRLPGENEFGSSPPRRLASSAAIRQYSTSSSTSSNASARSGLPWSSVSVRGQLVAARLDDVADRVHLRRALERRQPRPAVGGGARGVDRAMGVVAVALRAPSPITSPVAGLVASNVSPLALGAPLAADEHLLRGACVAIAAVCGTAGRGLVDTVRQLIYNSPIRPRVNRLQRVVARSAAAGRNRRVRRAARGARTGEVDRWQPWRRRRARRRRRQRRARRLRLQAGARPLAGELLVVRRWLQLHLDPDRRLRAVRVRLPSTRARPSGGRG